jgi:putative salt-induced outer membrane protein YdiY
MRFSSIAAFPAALLVASTTLAQTPPPPPAPPDALTGSVSVGLALTSGNKDTSTVNASYEVTHDPKTKNVIKSSGLFLRGSSDGTLTAEQLALAGRDEYALSKRTFVFGELRYLHDKFKQISYLIAPTAGVGHRLVDSPATLLSLSAGAGAVWEKNPETDVQASGAVTAEQRLSHKLSPTATVTQAATALWKTSDFADALYTFGAGIAVAVVSRAQVKVELLDTYKNRPPNADVQQNDVALVVGIVYKF